MKSNKIKSEINLILGKTLQPCNFLKFMRIDLWSCLFNSANCRRRVTTLPILSKECVWRRGVVCFFVVFFFFGCCFLYERTYLFFWVLLDKFEPYSVDGLGRHHLFSSALHDGFDTQNGVRSSGCKRLI